MRGAGRNTDGNRTPKIPPMPGPDKLAPPIRWRRVDAYQVCFSEAQTPIPSPQWDALGSVLARVNRTRGYGDYYHYHRLAAGQLDAVIESDVNILDIAALVVIVREAGGVFTDLDGRAPGLETSSVLAATPDLHADLLATLSR